MTQEQRDQLKRYLADIGYIDPKADELVNLFLTWLNDYQLYIASQ